MPGNNVKLVRNVDFMRNATLALCGRKCLKIGAVKSSLLIPLRVEIGRHFVSFVKRGAKLIGKTVMLLLFMLCVALLAAIMLRLWIKLEPAVPSYSKRYELYPRGMCLPSEVPPCERFEIRAK